MSDFIIQIGTGSRPDAAAAKLRDRPGMGAARLHEYRWPWGWAVVQEPRGSGYAPFEQDNEVVFCIGRPRIMGTTHEEHGADGFNRLAAGRWPSRAGDSLTESLTGMFALVRCHPAGFDVLTDQMGFQPVYTTGRPGSSRAFVGSDVETLAALAGKSGDFDYTSLGELLVYQFVTYPYTSRRSIVEIEPACFHAVQVGAGEPRWDRCVYWAPREPERFSDDAEELAARLEEAIRYAADDITRGSQRVAVTLSGGRDSRVIIAAVPRERLTGAITYVTRMNREVEVARRVAEACKVEQVLAQREPEFYSDLLLERGPALLGMERRGAVHGMCVVDNGLDRRFDLILGGQLSDTFLKDHFMPKRIREVYRPKGWRERTKKRLKQWAGLNGRAEAAASAASTIGRDQLDVHLTEDIREAVRARRAERLRQIEAVRPTSAEEWWRFWPTSRQDDLAHISGNMRLFAFDSLFMHRRIVEVARDLPGALRYGGRLAHRVFRRIYGDLGQIVDANTGLPADGDEQIRPKGRGRSADKPAVDRSSSAAPWNEVQNSWVDLGLLQTHSPRWQEWRKKLAGSPAVEVLERVLGPKATGLVEHYDPDLTPGFNLMFMQCVRMMDAALRCSPAAPPREEVLGGLSVGTA